jgi:serine/threonine-protein kinase
VRSAFSASDRPYAADSATRVTAELDRYAEVWRQQQHEACVATRVDGTQSDHRFEQRVRCLERRRNEARALVRVLREADERAIEHAATAVGGLVPPQRCSDPAFLDAAAEPPSDPAVAARVQLRREDLDGIAARWELGHAEEARTRALELLPNVEATAFAPLTAEALVLRARTEWHAGDRETARLELERSYFAAREAPLPEGAAMSALELASLYGTALGDFGNAHLWLRLAQTEIETHGLEHLEADRWDVQARIESREGDLAAAAIHGEQALALARERCPEGCTTVTRIRSELAATASGLGRYDEALTHAQLALDMEIALHGDKHPRTAHARSQLGQALARLGRVDEAIEELERAVDIRLAALEPHHNDIAVSLVQLGSARAQAGHLADGIADLERARDIARRGTVPSTLASALNELAGRYDEARRYADAAATYREALAVLRNEFADGHPNLAVVLSNLAFAEMNAGRTDLALEGFLEALRMRRATVQGPDPQLAGMLDNVAKALFDLGRREEAAPYLQEGIELTREGTLTKVGTMLRLRQAERMWAYDPVAARGLIEEAAHRCGALTAEQREHTRCGKLEAWLVEHPSEG